MIPTESAPPDPSGGGEWEHRRTAEGCVICSAGGPRHVIATFESCWATAGPDATLPHYVCVVARRHVIEPYELAPTEQARFWCDAMVIAEAVASIARPIKMNYEIHGNTLPHLHLHLFPRSIDDPFVGGPIDPRRSSVHRGPDEIDALRRAINTAG